MAITSTPVPGVDLRNIWSQAGVAVFPCDPADKKPLVKWGNASPDGFARAWQSHPQAMAGLDCGRVGIVVIDCDKTDALDGEANFRALCRELGVDLTNICCVRTPRGGLHFYFAQDKKRVFKNSASALAPGVDVRGIGGFVIAPGSIRGDGLRYHPITPTTLEDFAAIVGRGTLPVVPDALARQLLKAARPKHNYFPGNTLSPQAGTIIPFPTRTGAATYDESLAAGISGPWSLGDACHEVAGAPEGMRNATLNRHAYIAGLKVGSGQLNESDAITQLMQAAIAAGLGPAEIQNTIASGLLKGRAHGTANLTTVPDFDRTDRGAIRATFGNAIIAIGRLGVVARRNTFSDVIELTNAHEGRTVPSDHIGRLTDKSLSVLRKAIQDQLHFDPGKDHLYDAVQALAEAARHNPVTDWLDSLKWDGTERLTVWLPVITGCDASPLNRAAGLVLIAAMVARARYPGTKFDLCFVLEGPQGCGKSSLAKALAAGPGDNYFGDAPGLIGMDTKARAELVQGKWVVELSELSGLHRGEIEGVKAFLSQTEDQYRPAYGRIVENHARTVLFVATTNASEYLTDSTGNRRFLPIRCGIIDRVGFGIIRAQLFAEADAMVKAMAEPEGAKEGRALPEHVAQRINLPPKLWSAAAVEVDARRLPDPTEEKLRQLLPQLEQNAQVQPDGTRFISSADIHSALQIALNGRINLRGLGTLMADLGWKTGKIRDGGVQKRGYTRSGNGHGP